MKELLVSAFTKVARHACRQGENETREWPPLSSLPERENWLMVGRQYAQEFLDAIAAKDTSPVDPLLPVDLLEDCKNLSKVKEILRSAQEHVQTLEKLVLRKAAQLRLRSKYEHLKKMHKRFLMTGDPDPVAVVHDKDLIVGHHLCDASPIGTCVYHEAEDCLFCSLPEIRKEEDTLEPLDSPDWLSDWSKLPGSRWIVKVSATDTHVGVDAGSKAHKFLKEVITRRLLRIYLFGLTCQELAEVATTTLARDYWCDCAKIPSTVVSVQNYLEAYSDLKLLDVWVDYQEYNSFSKGGNPITIIVQNNGATESSLAAFKERFKEFQVQLLTPLSA